MSRRKKSDEAPTDDPAAVAVAEAPTPAETPPEGTGRPTHPVWKMSAPASRGEYVHCTVWENVAGAADNRFTVHSIQLDVRYKAGDEWRSGKSLRASMIPVAVWLLGQAYSFVMFKRATMPF